MSNRLFMLLLLVLATALLPLTARPSAANQPATIDPEVLGMVIRDPWYDCDILGQPNQAMQDRMGQMLAHLGVQQVRLEFHITDNVERDLSCNDYFINEVAPRHNFKVLGLLGFNLLRGRNPHDLNATEFLPLDETPYGGGVNEYIQTWLDRALLIAERYEGNITTYQILNEQNRMSDHTAIEAEVTARLLTKFYRLFHEGSEPWRDDVQIVLGGLHPAGTSRVGDERYVSDADYLRAIYESEAFRNYQDGEVFPIDGLGYHPYPEEIRLSPRSALTLIDPRLGEIRAVLQEVGDPNLPFWLTEIGYNAAFGNQTEEGQAAFMQTVYAALAARDDVAAAFWFKYEDFLPIYGFEQHWGVVHVPFEVDSSCRGGACYDNQGRPSLLRPSFWVYRNLAAEAGIELSDNEPPARIVLDAPRMLDIGQSGTLSATIERETVTLPISYSWWVDGERIEPIPAVSDSITFRRTRSGTYTILVEARNAAGTVITIHTIFVGEITYLPLVQS